MPVGEAIKNSFMWIGLVFKAIAGFFNPATFQTSVSQSSSVVGISVEVSRAVKSGPIDYAFIVALLSLSLGVMNILPIPPLDGGKIALEISRGDQRPTALAQGRNRALGGRHAVPVRIHRLSDVHRCHEIHGQRWLSSTRPRTSVACSRAVSVGGVVVGGTAPITVQSMTTADTKDPAATLAQIARLAEAGCEIVRVAIPRRDALDGFAAVCADSPLPVVADVHFDHTIAIDAARLRRGEAAHQSGQHRRHGARGRRHRRRGRGGHPHPDRRERRLACRGVRRPRLAACREARGERGGLLRALRGPRLHRHRGLGQGVERQLDGRLLPLARRPHPVPAARGRHRGGDLAFRHREVVGGYRHPAVGGYRRHAARLADRGSRSTRCAWAGRSSRHSTSGVAAPSW